MKKLILTIASIGLISSISFAQTDSKTQSKVYQKEKPKVAAKTHISGSTITNQNNSTSTTPSVTGNATSVKKQTSAKAHKVYSKQNAQPIKAKNLPKGVDLK